MTDNSAANKNYRLYYNQDGTPKFYTMEDLPGDYILVDHPTFESGRYDIVVRSGKIHRLGDIGVSRYVQVSRPTVTSIITDPDDITLVTVQDQPHIFWDYRSEE